MSKKIITYEYAKSLVYGGAILGGGGGGTIEEGVHFIEEVFKLNPPTLITLDTLENQEKIVTVSMVGAPSAQKKLPFKYLTESFRYFQEKYNASISGIITNEMGPFASVNGLLQSAATSIPIVDAPANGRAHPLSAMGAMGLSKIKEYISYQAGVSDKIKVWVESDINNASRLMREAAVLSGGLISITRNPVNASYLQENGAIGAIEFTHNLGEIWLNENNSKQKIEKSITFLKGEILGKFLIKDVILSMEGGFDIGKVLFDEYELVFWNEYMSLEKGQKRISTFPDLVVTFDPRTGLPLCSYELQKGREIIVAYTNYKNIILGSGMKDKELFRYTEEVIGKELISYLDLF